MTDHLSALDATFLELEQADETAHMHIGAALVFDPLPSGGAPTLDQLVAHLDPRLDALPRYRQRLSETHTGGLTWPAWEPDPHFDIRNHVHRAALPAPAGDDELLEWLGDYWSHRLDRMRPLWEIVLVEGLPGGRWALCTKTHHCLVDGVGSLDAGYVLLDTSPEPVAGAEWAPPAPAEDSNGHGIRHIPSRLFNAARAGAGLAVHPDRLADVLRRSGALAELLVRDEVVAAPSSSLNQPIGIERRFDIVRVPLAQLKEIKGALGGTVNDVALAAVSGGLRRLLLERGEEPPRQGLRAMVPVNIRDASEHLALGNRITSLFVHLPVGVGDPLSRYRATLEEAESLKHGSQALAGETLLELTAAAPPVLHSVLARSLFASRLFNVTVTNVPGPQLPLYALGARMREVFPLVPIAAEHAVGIAILSYDGNVVFGVNADRDTLPDVAVLVQGIEDSLDRMLALARTGAGLARG
ncbi:MAG TPA: wax ester/triacylglycerol synthase family O-acyltransferase [Thermoleophilaceae bacterium]|nr:wax ester/triacylglycerol synthase family O-acyltransferase [Thermoleophilaceae bacterium]